jgi:chorismate-pyruvate lyase
MQLLQQITTDDDTYMIAASPAQIIEVETRLKRLLTTYDSMSETLDGISGIVTDVLNHRDAGDDSILESQMITEMSITRRLEELACTEV